MAVDPVGYIFGGNTGLTYEQLKRRRAVAAALASQRRGYPKTVGEGLTYLGESIGDALSERRLDAAEKEYMARQERLLTPTLPGAAPAAPVLAPARPGAAPTPIAPRPAPPPPVRPPPAPIAQQAAPTAAALPPAPVLPSGPSSEAMTSGPPPSEFAMGGILNAAPMAAPNLEPAFPGETGGTGQAGLVPSSGYLPPAATAQPSPTGYGGQAAAPPSQSPAPQATAPPAPISPELQRAQDFQRSIGRPVTNAAGVPLDGVPAAPPSAPPGPQSDLTGFIAKQEGFRPTAYSDYKQTSIGYGTRGTPGETITREEAQRRLEGEVANARQSVEAFAPGAPPGVKDALTSLTYNAGPGWQRAGLGRLISEGRYDEARDRFLQYNKAGGSTLPGLVSRRNAELATLWDAQGGGAPADGQGGNIRLAAYAPDGGAGAPIPGMGGAGSPRLQPQIPPLQGPPPAPESEQITPTDIMPMPATAQFGPPVGRFSRTDAPVPGVAAPPPSQAPAVAPPPPQGPPPAAPARPAVSEEYTRQLPEPTPPEYPATLNAKEQQGWRIKTMAGGDPALTQHGELLMQQGKAEREMPYLRAVEQYKVELLAVRTENANRAKYQREQPETQQKLRKGEEEFGATQRAKEQEQRLGGIPVGDFIKTIEKSHEGVKNLPSAAMALENAKRSLIDEKMFTGTTAQVNLNMSKLLRTVGFPADPRVEATEQFKSYMAPIVAQARQALVGGAQISNADLQAAERAAAGDISLERDSIKGVLDSIGRINKAMAVSHQEKLRAFAGDDPNAQRIFDLYGLPVEQVVPVPSAAIERLRANAGNPQAYKDFDEAFGMPGLGRRYVPRR